MLLLSSFVPPYRNFIILLRLHNMVIFVSNLGLGSYVFYTCVEKCMITNETYLDDVMFE